MIKKMSQYITLATVLGATAASVVPIEAATHKRQEIVFWHSMTGQNEKAIQRVVHNFNNSQQKYRVVSEFQGQYVEALPKFLSVGGTKKAPDLFQSNEISTKQLATSGMIEPMQTLINKYHFQTKGLQKNILNYYTVDHKLYSMPFNSSAPVLYYNKDAFKAAGIDNLPENPTFEQVTAAAKQLKAKSGQARLSILPYGWLFEELLANQNQNLVNHGNGRKITATKATFNNQAGENILNWVKTNADNKALVDYGTGANAGDSELSGFTSGQIDMFMNSSASLGSIKKDAKFNVGVTYLPHPQSQKSNGVVIGGASIWQAKGKSFKAQKGSMAFLEFATSAKTQAQWSVDTGYFAVNKKAYQEPILKDAFKTSPMLAAPLNQLQATKLNIASSGALITSMSKERINVQNAMENVTNGKSVKDELKKANSQTTRDIKTANEQTGDQ
ncbi:ABC transporter substrate-binding protein [Weissella diestrammenae]|uniref:ABC transporter substrate-binding protein n=1 Tax=Weissella diestrammenae TaxID=1162633 RepID=A0A7G9T569_9LACO|nr:ABC transporter substrate-binding protein [Weissella diestrammenae]MCM0583100.1 ABC transporter substrate-binding protein [Weissella diestrammenae]QNN75244.1 ABC transporter substrate-binding protein [Weissella diestrammenae]